MKPTFCDACPASTNAPLREPIGDGRDPEGSNTLPKLGDKVIFPGIASPILITEVVARAFMCLSSIWHLVHFSRHAFLITLIFRCNFDRGTWKFNL